MKAGALAPAFIHSLAGSAPAEVVEGAVSTPNAPIDRTRQSCVHIAFCLVERVDDGRAARQVRSRRCREGATGAVHVAGLDPWRVEKRERVAVEHHVGVLLAAEMAAFDDDIV